MILQETFQHEGACSAEQQTNVLFRDWFVAFGMRQDRLADDIECKAPRRMAARGPGVKGRVSDQRTEDVAGMS